ncbi:MAG: thioredoxin family protein, partial [Anaerolineales bacterium]
MNKEEFLEKMRNNPRPVVVDFWAEWCMPCRAMEPALKRVQEAYQD